MSDTDPPATLSPVRAAFVDAAQRLVGLTQDDGAYQHLVAPGDTDAQAELVARTTSGCMLVRAGLEEAVLAVPVRAAFVPGTIPHILEARAGGSPWAPGGAWRIPTREAPPQVGDGLWYGQAGAMVEHVDACVLSVTPDDDGAAVDLQVVAGGQRDGAGRELVAELSRRLRWSGQRWIDLHTGRPVVGVLDADAYAARYGLA